MQSTTNRQSDGKYIISTSRVLLRAAQQTDAAALNEVFSNPEAMRYWSELPHKDLARTKEWVESMTTSTVNGMTDFVICLRSAEQNESPAALDETSLLDRLTSRSVVIGKCGVWQDNEIGFILNRRYWGMKLANEALEAILQHLFSPNIGKERIIADVDPRNVASLAVLRRFGFIQTNYREKTLLVGDEWVDSVDLELRREQWEASRIGTGR